MCFQRPGICSAGLLALCMLSTGCGGSGGDPVTTQGGSDQPASDDVEAPDTETPEDESSEGTESSDSGSSESDEYSYSGYDAVYLEQGWSASERRDFYDLKQGSQLVPYNWFVNLELPGSDELLNSDRHMASLGCITQPASDENPDGLPIGFVKDIDVYPITMEAAFLGPESDAEHFPSTESEWLGLTCAACHTADLTYDDKVIRIDGGAAMTDLEGFLASLAASMRATASDDAEFASFVNRIQESAGGNTGATPPREEFEFYTVVIEELVARNKAAHPYGLARLDAFGAILNQITDVAISVPENRRTSNAPVSYPFLWDAPHSDWVQWNSAAENPIGRNVGEALGVFAHLELTDDPEAGYASSARLDNLHRLEVALRTLKAPPWPAGHFGEIDDPQAAVGKELFDANCAGCHNLRDDDGDFRMTPPNAVGASFIKTTSIPFNEIGTDPQMVLNFATRTARPGILADAVADDMAALEASGGLANVSQLRASLGMPVPDFTQEVPAGLLLAAAVRGVTTRYLQDELANRTPEERQAIMLELRGNRPTANPRPNGGTGYRARPLNGVWATAPFLHNGSVPYLWELLKPEDERVQSFHVGSREFDPLHVGLSTEEVPGAFLFRTVSEDGAPIPGNSNLGHSGEGHTNFTDDERWAIIEYIKTLE